VLSARPRTHEPKDSCQSIRKQLIAIYQRKFAYLGVGIASLEGTNSGRRTAAATVNSRAFEV
jgi:hypothetical protein